MNQIKILASAPLFSGLTGMEIQELLEKMRVMKKIYRKGEVLLCAGDIPDEFGIVLSGCIHILREEFSGSITLLAQGMPGEIFAEAFAAAGETSLVTVEAARDTEVLWIHFERMMRSGAGKAQQTLVENMMQILAKKNLFLAGRVSHLSRRTLREKVLSYLAGQAARQGSRSFEIPFDRQGLADYLAADRSALSAVLGKLKKEGVLTFRKNHFTLLTEDEEAEKTGEGGRA